MIAPAARQSLNEAASIWKVFAQEFPKADLTDEPGLAIRWAESPFSFWNAVLLTEETSLERVAAARIRRAREIIRSKQEAGFLILCADYFRDLQADPLALAAAEQFSFFMQWRGMSTDSRRFAPALRPPAPLRMVRATDRPLLETYALLNCQAYGVPVTVAPTALSDCWHSAAFSYIAYDGDRPVSTAAAFPHGDTLYIGLVATAEDSRGRGYAETVLRHAVAQAREATGITETSLHATDAGFPVYERIGYQFQSTLHIYAPV